MTYINLGTRQQAGVIDANRGGLYTVTFGPQDLVVSVAEYEMYHISLTGPAGSQFQIFHNTVFYDNVLHGDINSWNPPQPLIMRAGDSLYFYWNSGTAPAPLVTISLRFDPAAQPLAGIHYS